MLEEYPPAERREQVREWAPPILQLVVLALRLPAIGLAARAAAAEQPSVREPLVSVATEPQVAELAWLPPQPHLPAAPQAGRFPAVVQRPQPA